MSTKEIHRELYLSLFNFYRRNAFYTGVLYTDCNDAFEYNIHMDFPDQNRTVVLYYNDEGDNWVLAYLNPDELTQTDIKRWDTYDRLDMLIAFTNACTMIQLEQEDQLARSSAKNPS